MTTELRSFRSPRNILDFPLRLRETAEVLADGARGVHQRRERGKVGGGVQAQEIEADALERGDALGEMRLGRPLARGQRVGIRCRGRNERSDILDLGARLGGASLERRDDRRQVGELLAVFDLNTLAPNEVLAVEVYKGGATMPLEYNTTRKTCGLLVIYTK
ncbi:MAG: hypothetical protein ACYC7F_05450 [Gemmatimonadaceae bacterium]